MDFTDSLILTVVDKLLIAVLVLVVGFWLNHRLEAFRATAAFRTALVPKRTQAYGELWERTRPLSPRDLADMDTDRARSLLRELRGWYYDEGNALYLSLDSADLFLRGLKVLERAELSREDIKRSFTALRTQLKVDLGIYSQGDAKTRIPRAS